MLHLRAIFAPRFVLPAAMSIGLGLFAGCGDDHGHGESFDDLVECVDEHASLTEAQAIAHCLVDYPDLHPDFADQQACVDYVAANGGYPDSRDAACMDYFEETGA